MKARHLSIFRMAIHEIARRRVSFSLMVLAVAVAVGAVLSTEAVLRAYRIRAERLLAEKEEEQEDRLRVLEDEMRKATLKLSFNLAILPGDQDIHEWHEKDYASTYMPEEYVHRLANSKLITVRHLLPMLQQKVKWPEQNRSLILIGCKGEVPNLHKDPRKPLIQPVPDGAITLGYELHHSLGLTTGQTVRLMEREFTVNGCHEERGSKDDITAWISLGDAQDLLGKPGLINGILALECVCVGDTVIDRIRAEVAGYLPDTKVIEFGTQVLARGEARERVRVEAREAMERERNHQAALNAERERFAVWAVPGVLAGCGAWIFLVALANARGRRAEVAILRTMGCRQIQVLALLVYRQLLGGCAGGVVGCGAGLIVANRLAVGLAIPGVGVPTLLSWPWYGTALVLGMLIGVLGGWMPAVAAAHRDPAQVLKEE